MGHSKSKQREGSSIISLRNLPREMLELIGQYLEIGAYYKLSMCNKSFYDVLWNNYMTWIELLKRDELSIPNTSQATNDCQSCINVYKNIVEACLEFETQLLEPVIQLQIIYDERSECMEVNTYCHSENYMLFNSFFSKINKFEELFFVLKCRKRSIVLKGYIVLNGIHVYNEDFQNEYTKIADLLSKCKDNERVKNQVTQGDFEDVTISELFFNAHGTLKFADD